MKFFVSYSRSVKDDVKQVIDLLRTSEHEVWWDGDIPIMADWWATILKNIEWCDVFIFVTSERSVQSAYCIAELKYANNRQHPILPFIIDDPTSYQLPPELPSRSQWLIYNGDPSQMLSQINVACDNIDWELHKEIQAPRPPEPMTGGQSLAKQFQEARHLANNKQFEQAMRLFRNIKSLDYGEWGDECDEWLARLTIYPTIMELVDDKSTLERAKEQWHGYVEKYGNEFDPHDVQSKLKRGQATSKISIILILIAIGVVGILAIINSFTPPIVVPNHTPTSSTPILSVTPTPTTTLTSTALLETATPTHLAPGDCIHVVKSGETLGKIAGYYGGVSQANIEEANNIPNKDVLQIDQSLVIPNCPTPPPPTSTPTQNPALLIVKTPVESNSNWILVEQEFDGVMMVLVPVGNFMMGSGNDDLQEITKPFWIDKYEVTQGDFDRLRGQKAKNNLNEGFNDNPEEFITWIEAQDFCDKKREGRLPTEEEWEYVARGPDNLIYPWGDDWNNGEYVVWSGNSDTHTASVGSHPEGKSWVGAMDMIGNVWEWTSSLSEDDDNQSNERVLRGGSYDDSKIQLRAAFRLPTDPVAKNGLIGFRCARSLAS